MCVCVRVASNRINACCTELSDKNLKKDKHSTVRALCTTNAYKLYNVRLLINFSIATIVYVCRYVVFISIHATLFPHRINSTQLFAFGVSLSASFHLDFMPQTQIKGDV